MTKRGPEDTVEDENPDVVVSNNVILASGAQGDYTGVVLVLIPADDDPISAASSEDAHMTTVWMGDLSEMGPDDLQQIIEEAQFAAANAPEQMQAVPESRGQLGDDGADVVFLSGDGFDDFRDAILSNSPTIAAAHDAVDQYPQWTKHTTLGYPDTPAAGDYDVEANDAVIFDRLGIWAGDEHYDFALGSGEPTNKETEMAVGARGPQPEDQPDPIPPDPVDDDFEDDQGFASEVPVHGVLAPEGVPTGDGRQFDIGALSTRQLPLPLRYELVGSHGGVTSDVVVVGRIDNAWRDDATNMWRFTGAIVLDKPGAQDALAGIIDGTFRGLSIDGDMMEVDTSGMLDVPEVADDAAALEAMVNPEPTILRKTRIAGATMVPIPAFQEAYVALGHEFAEDMSEEELVAAAAVLQACGCAEVVEPLDFRDISTEDRKRMADEGNALPDGSFPIANVDDLKNAIQSIGRAKDPAKAKAHIKKRASDLGQSDLIPDDWSLHATFAPGTHDGPGWITNPRATARIRRYWVSGPGAAKIKWGAPGDFNRCRSQLAKYVQNPEWLAGLCANMHKEALGFWPATHRKMVEGHASLVASGAAVAPIVNLVAAAAIPKVFPHEFFEAPRVNHAEPLTVTPEGRVYGYIAEWGVCHVGITGMCKEVPKSLSNYGYFKNGIIDTDQGPVQVGVITEMPEGVGHAGEYMSAAAATAHYDRVDSIRAYVNVGEDEYGVWYSGILAPGLTEEQIFRVKALGSLSGDWRSFTYGGNLEMIAACMVPAKGYQLMRQSMVASGGVQTAAIGIGRVSRSSLTAGGSVVLDPEMVAGIARTAVQEYRAQEALAARLAPARDKVRERRLTAARAGVKED